jgi:hypothetical protein
MKKLLLLTLVTFAYFAYGFGSDTTYVVLVNPHFELDANGDSTQTKIKDATEIGWQSDLVTDEGIEGDNTDTLDGYIGGNMAGYTFDKDSAMYQITNETMTTGTKYLLTYETRYSGGDAVGDSVYSLVLFGTIDGWDVEIAHQDSVYGYQYIKYTDSYTAVAKDNGKKLVIGLHDRSFGQSHKNAWQHFDDLVLRKVIPVSPSLVNENSIVSQVAYPNPSTGIVNLKASANSNVEVFNTIGELVKIVKLENSNSQIDLSNLAKGVYFVNINSGNAVKTEKLILK